MWSQYVVFVSECEWVQQSNHKINTFNILGVSLAVFSLFLTFWIFAVCYSFKTFYFISIIVLVTKIIFSFRCFFIRVWNRDNRFFIYNKFDAGRGCIKPIVLTNITRVWRLILNWLFVIFLKSILKFQLIIVDISQLPFPRNNDVFIY